MASAHRPTEFVDEVSRLARRRVLVKQVTDWVKELLPFLSAEGQKKWKGNACDFVLYALHNDRTSAEFAGELADMKRSVRYLEGSLDELSDSGTPVNVGVSDVDD